MIAAMKFMTRELYQGLQNEPASAEFANFDARWKSACEAYRARYQAIRMRLPTQMQRFSEETLHDGKVRTVDRRSPSELVLVVDARQNPWGPRGIFRIRFTGVRLVEGTDNLVGDDWLYEEVDLHPDGGFDYRVMFWRSDFRIVADDVDVRELSA